MHSNVKDCREVSSSVVRLSEATDFLAPFPKFVFWFEGNPCVKHIKLKLSKDTIVFNFCLRLVRELPGLNQLLSGAVKTETIICRAAENWPHFEGIHRNRGKIAQGRN